MNWGSGILRKPNRPLITIQANMDALFPQAKSHQLVINYQLGQLLTHWGRVTHSKLTIIGSDNGLSPGRGQAIIWTNAGILLIRTLETNFSEIVSEIHASWFKKMHLKMSFAK